MTANFPAAMEWLDAVGDMIDHQKPVPSHINPSEFEWVRDAVDDCSPYFLAIGIQPPGLVLWVTDPVRAIRQARQAMRALQTMDTVQTGGVCH